MGKLTYKDMKRWLEIEKIRHCVIANSRSRSIDVIIRLENFKTLVVKCDGKAYKPDGAMIESAMVTNVNFYESVNKLSNDRYATVYDYSTSKGYTNAATCFFACAIISFLST
jgi:hypothetical protein